MEWKYEFIVPWTKTSPANDIYTIPIRAFFGHDSEIDDDFDCEIDGYLKYFNPGSTF